jgi:hypothetical protein
MMIDFIRRSWPSLFDTDVRKVIQRDCEAWLADTNSSTRRASSTTA